MGEVIQLQGDQRKDVQEFLTDKKEGLELDAKTIKVCFRRSFLVIVLTDILFRFMASRRRDASSVPVPSSQSSLPSGRLDRRHDVLSS